MSFRSISLLFLKGSSGSSGKFRMQISGEIGFNRCDSLLNPVGELGEFVVVLGRAGVSGVVELGGVDTEHPDGGSNVRGVAVGGRAAQSGGSDRIQFKALRVPKDLHCGHGGLQIVEERRTINRKVRVKSQHRIAE
jgi:hypothetical protein